MMRWTLSALRSQKWLVDTSQGIYKKPTIQRLPFLQLTPCQLIGTLFRGKKLLCCLNHLLFTYDTIIRQIHFPTKLILVEFFRTTRLGSAFRNKILADIHIINDSDIIFDKYIQLRKSAFLEGQNKVICIERRPFPKKINQTINPIDFNLAIKIIRVHLNNLLSQGVLGNYYSQ
ncbi:hypothetical protein BLA13014_08177 [Burkholderia aenigmatica]|uniref:Uncharacterized protein n=1 Tax=Burkholderia aenigmatica TaxID=2015348 RepID=A0A6P2SV84_9BURK|nr:hypothetical protein BLA13014_08177 [Burkholderia aenigmatica]